MFREAYIDRIAVLDTETTNTDPLVDDIIEFSTTLAEGGELMNYTTRLSTSVPIHPMASSIHFIVHEDLIGEPSFSDVEPIITQLLQSREYYIGHNVEFDRSMLVGNYARHTDSVPSEMMDDSKWIDTYTLAKHLYSQDDDIENLKLGYLWFKFELNKRTNKKIQPHCAEDDVYMCYELFNFMVEECFKRGIIAEEDTDVLKRIREYCDEPIEYLKMPWGKFKGVEMKDLDMSYMEWLITKSDAMDENSTGFDPDLAYTILLHYSAKLEKLENPEI